MNTISLLLHIQLWVDSIGTIEVIWCPTVEQCASASLCTHRFWPARLSWTVKFNLVFILFVERLKEEAETQDLHQSQRNTKSPQLPWVLVSHQVLLTHPIVDLDFPQTPTHCRSVFKTWNSPWTIWSFTEPVPQTVFSLLPHNLVTLASMLYWNCPWYHPFRVSLNVGSFFLSLCLSFWILFQNSHQGKTWVPLNEKFTDIYINSYPYILLWGR